jgi:hypothetical protein
VPTDPRQNSTPEDGLDSIVGFHGLWPIRRGRRPLVISKPPKPVNQMTYEEIDAWAGELVDGMAAGMERP